MAKLTERGGDSSRRFREMGYEAIRVASDERRGGSCALIFHVDGSWSIKFSWNGCPLTNPSLEEILKEYGQLEDPKLRKIYRRQLAIQSAKRDLPKWVQEESLDYVRENRRQLLEGLIRNMEKATQQLRGQAETS